jgi:hypothetical protein
MCKNIFLERPEEKKVFTLLFHLLVELLFKVLGVGRG